MEAEYGLEYDWNTHELGSLRIVSKIFWVLPAGTLVGSQGAELKEVPKGLIKKRGRKKMWNNSQALWTTKNYYPQDRLY